MNSERALNEQIERYRHMTGEQRLAIALKLHEVSCNVAREGSRQPRPEADEAGVERQLRRRLELRPAMTEQDLLVDCLRRLSHAENLSSPL